MSKKKTPEAPTYRTGKYTGYTLKDGKYYPAPTYVDQFKQLAARRAAIDGLMKVIFDHATHDQERIETAQRALWKTIGDDYGIDLLGREWVYSLVTQSIEPKKSEKEAQDGN